ncbi:MAG: septal ring lytic transglycosylase RlpA family protein [Spirochaetales bacterium]|nr:septal ring lytic transglycosylase RlpA family protein [Spirochaetales bacterium]
MMKALILPLVLIVLGSCASSQPRSNPNDDESEFFIPLSERDRRSGAPGDCQCDYKKESGNYFESGPVENAGPPRPVSPSERFSEEGMASWYGREFDGKKTASGELFDSRRLTAAHRTLPLGSTVRVRNLDNGKEVVLTINDRGPYVQNRILDVSEYGAELLDYKRQGLARIGITVLREGNSSSMGLPASEPAPAPVTERATEPYFPESSAGRSSYNLEERLDTSYGTPAATGRFQNRPADADPYVTSPRYETPASAPANTPAVPAQIRGKFSVQAGVFSSQYNAEQFRDSLRRFGQPVYVVRTEDRFGVRIGNFNREADAARLKRTLEEDGHSGMVVRN